MRKWMNSVFPLKFELTYFRFPTEHEIDKFVQQINQWQCNVCKDFKPLWITFQGQIAVVTKNSEDYFKINSKFLFSKISFGLLLKFLEALQKLHCINLSLLHIW